MFYNTILKNLSRYVQSSVELSKYLQARLPMPSAFQARINQAKIYQDLQLFSTNQARIKQDKAQSRLRQEFWPQKNQDQEFQVLLTSVYTTCVIGQNNQWELFKGHCWPSSLCSSQNWYLPPNIDISTQNRHFNLFNWINLWFNQKVRRQSETVQRSLLVSPSLGWAQWDYWWARARLNGPLGPEILALEYFSFVSICDQLDWCLSWFWG